MIHDAWSEAQPPKTRTPRSGFLHRITIIIDVAMKSVCVFFSITHHAAYYTNAERDDLPSEHRPPLLLPDAIPAHNLFG